MISWIVALFVGGVVLLLLEFVMPGLICGIVGSIMLLGSFGMALYHYPDHTGLILLAGALSALAIFALGMWVMPRFSSAIGLIQTKEQRAEEGYVNMPERTDLLQREGEVFSALRPAGVIIVGDERLDAVSDAVFIDKGARVRVIAVEGNRIVVEAI